MIKFRHKKHLNSTKEKGKILIYYSISDIFLGAVLMALVVFFMNDYLSHTIGRYKKMQITNNMHSNLLPKVQNNINSLKP